MNLDTRDGAPLASLAEYHAARGWQLVACQWHVDQRTGRRGTTPLAGMTGSRVSFLTGSQVVAKIRCLVLHPEGGPNCTGRNAKPAIRPPLHVVGIDVDHGYDSKTGVRKTGGDTLVNAEMALGPLPGTWSLTARGPWQPSRRLWFRQPADLVFRDDFFREFGGDIEVIRTGHRFSWTWPAVHTKGGRVVGPVLWYDANHNVVPLPHVDDLPELPAAWVRRGYELMAAHAAKTAPASVGGAPGEAAEVTERHADAMVAKSVAKFMEPDCRGGEFRNVMFGLAANVTRRALARGHGEAEVWEEIRELFRAHPWRRTPNEKDIQWTEDGIRAGTATPWEFSPYDADGYLTDRTIAAIWECFPEGCSPGDAALRDDLLTSRRGVRPESTEAVPTALEPVTVVHRTARSATDDELNAWVDTYVSHHTPGRLRKRVEWLRTGHLAKHTRALVDDVLAGHYPARQAAIELHRAYRARGGTDPKAVSNLLAAALGAVLYPKVGAR